MPRLNTNKFHSTHMLTVDEVVDLDTLIDFLNSRCGSPLPLKKDRGIVSKNAKSFFESYPDAEWSALTDLAVWAKTKNKHLSMVQLVGSWRYAYQDGFMRILQRGGSTNDDLTLRNMVRGINDEEVRTRMVNAPTSTARDEIYQDYLESSTEAGVPVKSLNDPLMGYGLGTGQVVKVRLSAADNQQYGTVIGLSGDNRLLVYVNGEELPVRFDLVYVRNNETWECLLDE